MLENTLGVSKLLNHYGSLDTLLDAQFNLGRALSAVMVFKDGSTSIASFLFSKSCLFALRSFVLAELKEFPSTYDAVVKKSAELELNEFSDLPQIALSVREGTEYNPNDLFRNISLINQIIVPKLRTRVEKEGGVDLI